MERTTSIYGFDIAASQYGPRGALEVGEVSMAGNIIIRAGRELGSGCGREQVAHVVLTPTEARTLRDHLTEILAEAR